ncbi:MAG: zinc-dependent peptidase [Myxococcota bacterium]
MNPRDGVFAAVWATVAGAGAALVVAALGGPPGWIVAGGAAGALLPLAGAALRRRRRARLDRQPFPEGWRRVLERNVDAYRHLDEADRRRFEQEVRAFLAEHVVTGPRGTPLDDEVRVLVAASAVILVFRRPGFRYPRLRDVIVYPDAFSEEYEVQRHGSRLGEVGGQGPVILSERALREGFADPDDGSHVGLHEFAHVLDMHGGHADGVPSLMPWRCIRPWLDLVRRETRRVRRRRSVLRRYAAKNEAEFFAVATEVFFERPRELADKHPELYRVLRETYGQDPRRHAMLGPSAGAEALEERAPRGAERG